MNIEQSQNYVKKDKLRLIVLIIFIVIVCITSITLTVTYKEDNDNVININKLKSEYLVDNGKIKLLSFSVTYDDEHYYIDYIIKKMDNVVLTKDELAKYNIIVYDENNNIIKKYDSTLWKMLSFSEEMTCQLIGDYTGSKVSYIEIEERENSSN